MSVPSKITNHSEIAYQKLLGQFKDKPVIAAVLQTWTDAFQEVENDLYDLMLKTLFLSAEGGNLERYGQLLGISFPEGLSDSAYRELLISEIMRRSSDGTPDRIRQILEATTGMTGTRIIEHYNGNQRPFVMGAHLIYGYADSSVTFDVSSETKEAYYTKWASPVTTGSTVLGVHRGNPDSLFIPSELVLAPLAPLGLTSNKTENPTFDLDLADWVIDPAYTSYVRDFEDPQTGHHDGVLQVDMGGVADSTSFSQTIVGLDNTQSFTVSVRQANEQGYTSRLEVDTGEWLPNFDRSMYISIPDWVTVDSEIEHVITLDVERTSSDAANTYYLLDGEAEGAEAQYLMVFNNNLYFAPIARVFVDSVEVTSAQFEVMPDISYKIEYHYVGSGAIQFIGKSWSGGLGDLWEGVITNARFYSDSILQRHYPLTYDSSPSAPTDADPVLEVLNNFNGTAFNSSYFNRPKTYEIVGTAEGVVEFSKTDEITIRVVVNTEENPDAIFTYDNFEVYNSKVGWDQDSLVDQADDWIAIRQGGYSLSSTNSENGLLAEFENQVHALQVDTSTADGVTPPNVGIEDFTVDTSLGIEGFNVEFRDADRPSNSRGIMLEISQASYRERIQ
jgi:hypothetical protein